MAPCHYAKALVIIIGLLDHLCDLAGGQNGEYIMSAQPTISTEKTTPSKNPNDQRRSSLQKRHGTSEELESLRIEYQNLFDRSNKLDNKTYITITFSATIRTGIG